MTIELNTLGSETEAAVVATLAMQAAEVAELEPGTVYARLSRDGGIEFADTDEYDVAPRRAKASRTVTDAESFVKYANRHKTPGTEVFAHTSASSVVAVIDSHQGTDELSGWQSHRLTLTLEHSKAWLAWAEHDLGANPRGWFSQQEFAEFIEDRALDVQEPDHARLIEIATKFEATSKVDFGSAVRLDNGEVQFQYVETVAAKKGTKGEIEFPKELKLAIRPYIGGPIYFVFASFRYRIGGDGLRLGYALQRPENILEAAFSDIVTEIREGKTVKTESSETRVHDGIGDVPIFYGRP
ncbi:uncharacterized protein YfdQ (DUF2303 family) [Homoserinimonas aerilata]|uniref:Uncharacterized protein YfdQ (DUF2303 family) n=1 Tax=Homoserinimonas aerilata TaxID=1162970 RepID=A0A542YF27_9MICO|nr:DUF2303 family protein [Homoserinimonas aerilata]TQL46695.1 uncharacterized protein YfdQ (DUF2303 family) [Homoserinimonas aerilata]